MTEMKLSPHFKQRRPMELSDLPLPIQQQIKSVSQGQEEVFARYLLEQLKSDPVGESDDERSSAMDYYKSMLNDEHARILAERETLGIAPLVQKQLVQSVAKHYGQTREQPSQQARSLNGAKKE